MDIFKQIIFCFTNLYTCVYGDYFAGYLNNGKFIEPNFYEKYFILLPSYINHLYSKYFYNNYFYIRNNMIYLSSIKPSNKLNAPLLEFKINNIDFKNEILKFSNNIPFKFIFEFYKISKDSIIEFKFLKSGIKSCQKNFNEISELDLFQILE